MRYRVLAIAIMSIVVISLLVAGCGSKKINAEIATQVAKDWTSANATYVSEEITRTIGAKVDVDEDTLRSIVEDQVSNNITWIYSQPEKLSDSAYNVTARTKLNYEIPHIGSGSIDVGFDLTCYTSEVKYIVITYYSDDYETSLEVLDDDDD